MSCAVVTQSRVRSVSVVQIKLGSERLSLLLHRRSYGCFKRLMSNLRIWISACMTLSDFFGSLSCNILLNTVGTICQDSPYLSFSQPHCPSSPPSESFSHSSSTSFCVLQFTTNDMASVNLKCGPPFNAANACPSSWNAMVITVPLGLPETFAPSSP